ncbi:MAG: ComEA family DNA-binding protein [Candidatus Aminicenantia bacterium]
MNKHLTKILVLVISLGVLLAYVPSMKAAPQAQGTKKININTASLAELQKLPRVGVKVAQRIIDYRKQHGKFKRVEEIMKVRGIGEKTFLKMKDRITVGNVK